MAHGHCARCYLRAYNRRRRATDPAYRARGNAAARAYQRQRPRADVSAATRLYRQRHPDRVRAAWNRWEVLNAEKTRESNRASAERARRKDPEKRNARTRAWFAKNKPYRILKENERRARKLGGGGRVSREEWEAIKDRQQQRCAYCGEQKVLTQDHVVPLSKGGPHVATNIVAACRPCNSRKKDRILV